MKQKARAWLLVFVVLGLGASVASLYVHDRMLRNPAYSSFCNFKQIFNCEIAYHSPFGAFHGVPVALLGVIWFTLALMLLLADAKRGAEGSAAVAYLFVL